MDKSVTKGALVQQAKKIVDEVHNSGVPLMAACIVSSVAADDFTDASDIDMLMVAADGDSRPEVYRRLVQDRVFEWEVVSRTYLQDVESILKDAGLTHDLLTAIILRDDDGFLSTVQAEVANRYQEPEGIWLRTENQLNRMREASERMCRQAEEPALLSAQQSHVSVLKAAFGLPRALRNKRCTMTRGLMFCRQAAQELDWPEYIPDVLELFGVQNTYTAAVVKLRNLAEQIIRQSGFTPQEKAIRLRHLEGSRWLQDNADLGDAVWPLYFWSSTNVKDAGGENSGSCWQSWCLFGEVLRVDTQAKLQVRSTSASRFVQKATDLIEDHWRRQGYRRSSSQQGTAADADKLRR